jgi:hypothetical protein
MSADSSPEEIPEALPVNERRRRPPCPHCGAEDATRGLKLGISSEVGSVGIPYEATGRFLGLAALGSEALLLDLCNACGTVIRFYVKETERKWAL